MAFVSRAGRPACALTAPRRLLDCRLRGWTRALLPALAGSVGVSQTRGYDLMENLEQDEAIRILMLAKDKLSRQGPRHIFDVTSPTPSHMLNVAMDGQLPSAMLTPEYNLNGTNHPLSPMSRMPMTMPQGHHLVYFPTPIQPALLEPDGTDPWHSPGGGFSRRVWASGSIDFTKDALKLDSAPAVCVETIEKVESNGVGANAKILIHILRRYMPFDKTGRSRFNPNNTNCLTETRVLALLKEKPPMGPFEKALRPDLVRQAKEEQSARIVKPPWIATHTVDAVITPQMLFYFSALTMNAHAIHYDTARTKFIEGHRGLLVHGPLCVVLMLSALRSVLLTGHNAEAVKFFEYRNIVPMYADKPHTICVGMAVPDRNPAYKSLHRRTVWIADQYGSLVVKGTAYIGAKKGIRHDEVRPDHVPRPPPTEPLPEWVTSPPPHRRVTHMDDFPMSDTWRDERGEIEARKMRRERVPGEISIEERIRGDPDDPKRTVLRPWSQKRINEAAERAAEAEYRRRLAQRMRKEGIANRTTWRRHLDKLVRDHALKRTDPDRWHKLRRWREIKGIENERLKEVNATAAFVSKYRRERSDRPHWK
ncbi:3-hydroxyacyl-thioester dehydratase [Microdochium nivale]|nr:3-hydroxyacyl-thioester dehydratase [Microdochium nivale]